MTHPVLSATGTTDNDQRVIWHLQTMPNPHAGIETGAWLVDPGSPEETNLLTDTITITAADLPAVVASVRAAYEDILAHADDANPPRLPAFEEPDQGALAASYHGEPAAKDTWVLAQSLRALIELWHATEAERRKRKYLRAALGEEVRPFPYAKNR